MAVVTADLPALARGRPLEGKRLAVAASALAHAKRGRGALREAARPAEREGKGN
jgi:hypothetical protein